MRDNIFKTEILDYASKLDAVTNSYGEIVKAASAIVEEHDNSSTVYLINHTSKLVERFFIKDRDQKKKSDSKNRWMGSMMRVCCDLLHALFSLQTGL